MSDPLFLALVVLLAAAFVWLALVWRLFAMMKVRTPDAYVSIGAPHIILNNTIPNNVLFVRFLLGGQYAAVGDVGVRRLSAFLRALFWCFAAGSGALVAVILGILHA